MVFASSNHLIGFHERGEVLDDDSSLRADSYYGLSKAYGELMGRLYWDKHGVESVFLRIGSCLPEPIDNRMLATWLSYSDLTRMVERSTLAPSLGPTGCLAIWGASKNSRMTWWRKDGRAIIGWEPQDSADGFADRLSGRTSGSPVAERYQGGGYTATDYSRAEPAPKGMFPEAALTGSARSHICMRVRADVMLPLRCAMIHSEPPSSRMTMRIPKANAITLLVLSGPVVMCRKNTRCTPICAMAKTMRATGMAGAQMKW